jgi:hypothetical protein
MAECEALDAAGASVWFGEHLHGLNWNELKIFSIAALALLDRCGNDCHVWLHY